MAFTINLSGTNEVDDSVRQEFDTEFRLAFAEQGAASQVATLKRDIGAESISLPKYEQLELAITPLDEYEDVDSEALQDSKVVIIPQEYGKVVTTTKLANIVTGGMADRAAARVVAINAGRTQNKLATLAMDLGTNILRQGGYATDIEVLVTDTMDGSFMGKIYNKLSAASVPTMAGGDYVLIAHENVIHDMREQSGANSWIDAHKYALPESILRNEVGMYKGMRVIRDNLSTIVTDGAAGTVDMYHSYGVGFNALGLAVSQGIEMRATGPFDKLGRMVNLGWHGVFNFKVVEQTALVVAKCASSVGANA